MNPKSDFDIHWPVRRGRLNLHSGVGGSLTAVLADLEVIWTNVIQQYLDIPIKDLKVYRFQISFSGSFVFLRVECSMN